MRKVKKSLLAKRLGVSRTTLWRRERENKIKAQPTGGGQTIITYDEAKYLFKNGIRCD